MRDGPLSHPRGAEDEFSAVPAADLPSLLDDLRAEAVAWLESRVDAFDPFAWNSLEERRALRTAFAEAATCQYVLDRAAFSRRVDGLDELLFDRVNDPRYHQPLYRNPREILNCAAPVSYAAHRDELEPEVRRLVRAVLESESVWTTERLPHEHLQLWHLCNAVGVEYPHDVDGVVGMSTMANPPNAAVSDLNDAYALTHDVLYRYDFGSESDSVPLSVVTPDFEASLTGLTARFLCEGNYDVVLELAAAGAVTGGLDDAVLRHAFSWVAAAAEGYDGVRTYDEEGAFERSQFSYRFGVEAETLRTNHADWAADYHANLVAAIASTAARRRCDGSGATATRSVDDTSGLSRAGGILALLSAYELERAASRTRSLVESRPETVRRYPGVFDQIARYLSSQRTPDGAFGVWPQEAELRAMLSEAETPLADARSRGVTEACRDALAALDAASESAE